MTVIPSSANNKALIFAPRGRDAEVARNLLEGAGIPSCVCANSSEFESRLDEDACFAVVTEEALRRSPNGDTWFLAREPADGRAFIIHQPNAPSGGQLSHMYLVIFLGKKANGPEHLALLRLIGTLVEIPPYADRT